jgi:hypothetical protein
MFGIQTRNSFLFRDRFTGDYGAMTTTYRWPRFPKSDWPTFRQLRYQFVGGKDA